ncbi:MAG: serine/threonine-protein phosphatase [Lachnospiraceae bacterium]|nr:serine/threonine-protein phosphatase [Lachnospiraceae bacterium]
MSYRLFSSCISDKGNFRRKNQDRAVCLIRNSGKKIFAAACVCDGIGSFEMSEFAAELVTSGIKKWFRDMEGHCDRLASEEILADLECTIYELNELVCEYQDKNDIAIGCTMSLMLFLGGEYFIFHVGDSRIYSVKDSMDQLTPDEVVQKNKEGQIKSYLANYMGKSRKLWLNKRKGVMQSGEMFLLGTDGVFKLLRFEDIVERGSKLCSDRRLAAINKKIIKTVRVRGERDNASSVLLYVHQGRQFRKKEP